MFFITVFLLFRIIIVGYSNNYIFTPSILTACRQITNSFLHLA